MATQKVQPVPEQPPLNEAKLNEFMQKAIGDMGAAMNASLIAIGEQLGLYKAMGHGEKMSPAQLAMRTNTAERYVREWLNAQAASGYCNYDSASGKYWLDPEQAFALAKDDSPAYVPGFFLAAVSVAHDVERLMEGFQTGQGVGWHEHHHWLFEGTEKFFRPGYNANLISSWLPALEGVEEKLKKGAKVADVGCGHGASTLIMARAYPNSTFIGFDYHSGSIERARTLAVQANLENRVEFEVASAKAFPGNDYDLITFFDCLHDMGDPVGAARHVFRALKPGGVWMIVEPRAEDTVEGNLNPVGRVFYAASTMICTPASLSQEVGLALGAQAGEKRIGAVVQQGGFHHFRRATETPFNLIFEAKR
jgi:SAM-dependent methyltransferase